MKQNPTPCLSKPKTQKYKPQAPPRAAMPWTAGWSWPLLSATVAGFHVCEVGKRPCSVHWDSGPLRSRLGLHSQKRRRGGRGYCFLEPFNSKVQDDSPHNLWGGFEYQTEFGPPAYALGYDSVNDDYKLVGFAEFRHKDPFLFTCLVQIYSLKSNSWKRIQNINTPRRGYRFNFCNIVFVNGSLCPFRATLFSQTLLPSRPSSPRNPHPSFRTHPLPFSTHTPTLLYTPPYSLNPYYSSHLTNPTMAV